MWVEGLDEILCDLSRYMPLPRVSSFPFVCLFIHSCPGQALTLSGFEKLVKCMPGRTEGAFNTSFLVKMGNPYIFAVVLR